jgi:hypothetical protein
MKGGKIKELLWKHVRVDFGTEEEREKKKRKTKTTTSAKLVILSPHALPRNKSDTVKIATQSFKLEFGDQMTLYTLFESHRRSHMCSLPYHVQTPFSY